MEMELDWDLHAVVRGCSTLTSSSASSSSSSSSSGFGYFYSQASPSSVLDTEDQQHQQQGITNNVMSFSAASYSYPFGPRTAIEELHELCKPFFTKSLPQQHQQQQSLQASSPLSSFSVAPPPPPPKPVHAQEKQQRSNTNKHPHPGGDSVNTPRSKRRKNQLKRVCQVPVENLSSDIWAWRKYGQKPIKGSPYPRGYYRCSSSKGCLARKQVERNRTDPTMFIVTYTAEHNHPAPTHRNSLAGSTRQKPLTPQAAAATTTNGGESDEKALTPTKSASPDISVAEEEALPQHCEKSSVSREEKEEDLADDDDDEFGLSDMVIPDDFFDSFDELKEITGIDDDGIRGDNFFVDPFSAIAMPSWVANSAATAAGSS